METTWPRVSLKGSTPRWYTFSLVAADGSVGGRGRVVANSPASASRFATMFLAGTSTVRLDEEAGDE